MERTYSQTTVQFLTISLDHLSMSLFSLLFLSKSHHSMSLLMSFWHTGHFTLASNHLSMQLVQ